jgi:hypothetical protein
MKQFPYHDQQAMEMDKALSGRPEDEGYEAKHSPIIVR